MKRKGIKRKRCRTASSDSETEVPAKTSTTTTTAGAKPYEKPQILPQANSDPYLDLFQPALFGGGGGGGAGGHDPSGIKPEPVDPNLSFASIAGLDELIEEVRTRIIFPIVNKEFVERHGRSPPKGILLHGPPGTGKTLFVQCLAAELSRLTSTKYTFFMRRGSDIMSMWVGQSEKNLREIFFRAIQCKPSILFFDEVDGLAPNRNNLQSSIPVYTNIVTTLLGEMDKIESGDVLVVCATNRKDAVDPAMKRPGRCDVHIQFSPPNINGRRRIIQLYTKSWGPSSPGSKLLHQISMGTNGFTGADLDKLCSEAFFACVRRTQRCADEESGSGSRSRSRRATSCEVRKVGDGERILVSDWLEALTSMAPSQSNVFGSYIQVLQVSDFIQPLIHKSSKSLMQILRPHCLNENEEKTTNALIKQNIGGPNCFLAWNGFQKSDEILDALVVPAILGHFSNMSVFVLNEEAMLQEHKQFTINAIVDIIKQAKDYPKPCILYIPRIDQLGKRLGPEVLLVRKLLFDTATKSVLVLATAGCDVTGLARDLQPIFDGHEKSWKLEKPQEVERREFYAQIFNDGGSPGAGGDGDSTAGDNYRSKRNTSTNTSYGKKAELATRSKVTMSSLLEECVKATDHEDMWSMITLHRELSNACKLHRQDLAEQDQRVGPRSNPNNLVKMLKDVVDAYKESRLDSSKRY